MALPHYQHDQVGYDRGMLSNTLVFKLGSTSSSNHEFLPNQNRFLGDGWGNTKYWGK